MNVCLAKDRHHKPCRCAKIIVDGNPTDFCKFHQYMNEGYTAEMLENLELCKGCNKMYYFGEGLIKTCDKCVARRKITREKEKENKVLCKKEGCIFKRSKENNYCLKHQLCVLENEVKDEGKKLCANYIRGCRTKLELHHPFTRCEDCLQKERETDYTKRHGVLAVAPKNENHKICTICCKEYSSEHFTGAFGVTKTCSRCREQNKIQDAKRDTDKRNAIARVNDSKPERIVVKKEWKEQNYEKVAGYWMKSRQRLIEAGIEEYLKKNAENAQNWRDNNPEKVLQNNENKKNSLSLQYGVYQRTAELKNLIFELSLETFCEIVQQNCHYCGEFSENKTFNGIDRKDQTKGYVLDNCVPSCQMCNMIKNTLNEDKFLQKIEHILSHNKLILNGNLYPDSFANRKKSSISYNKYKDRANKKNFEFSITENEFITITQKPCYLCGKQTDGNHKNGIDRYNSKIGYVLENCRACCGDCNYMKRNFDYDEVIRKFMLIYKNSKKLYGFDKHPENTFLSISNKKSPEEMKNKATERKRLQRERLKEKYGDEEYKKLHAKKIAEDRKRKKERDQQEERKE